MPSRAPSMNPGTTAAGSRTSGRPCVHSALGPRSRRSWEPRTEVALEHLAVVADRLDRVVRPALVEAEERGHFTAVTPRRSPHVGVLASAASARRLAWVTPRFRPRSGRRSRSARCRTTGRRRDAPPASSGSLENDVRQDDVILGIASPARAHRRERGKRRSRRHHSVRRNRPGSATSLFSKVTGRKLDVVGAPEVGQVAFRRSCRRSGTPSTPLRSRRAAVTPSRQRYHEALAVVIDRPR